MHIYSFENLEVWQLSRKLVKRIYLLTENFPQEEKFGLISQFRRASISVSLNISEGSARKSPKDQARFTEISYGSLLEVLNLLILLFDLGFITNEKLINERPFIEELGNKLNALHNSQKRRNKG